MWFQINEQEIFYENRNCGIRWKIWNKTILGKTEFQIEEWKQIGWNPGMKMYVYAKKKHHTNKKYQ